jgi:transposase InsO family protein
MEIEIAGDSCGAGRETALDMTSVWVAEHGGLHLNAIIDCWTREITGWALDVRCRATEALTVVE